MPLEQLIQAVQEAVARISPAAEQHPNRLFEEVMEDAGVRACLGWESPRVDDLTEATGSSGGSVHAVRYDELAGGVGLKHVVRGSYSLFHNSHAATLACGRG